MVRGKRRHPIIGQKSARKRKENIFPCCRMVFLSNGRFFSYDQLLQVESQIRAYGAVANLLADSHGFRIQLLNVCRLFHFETYD